MTKTIAVGMVFPDDSVEQVPLRSRSSLLDWDLILFQPNIWEFIDYGPSASFYLGKPALNDYNSASLQESCEHWRREIQEAFEAGKNVVVFMPPVAQVYIDSGRRDYSGTGRNRSTTRLVNKFNNYEFLPVDIGAVDANGSSMTLTESFADALHEFWQQFRHLFSYRVLVDAAEIEPIICTASGGRVVGGLYRNMTSGGLIVALPYADLTPDEFYLDEEVEDGDGNVQVWTAEALQFGTRFLKALVLCCRHLRSEGGSTAPPEWTRWAEFQFQSEAPILAELSAVQDTLEATFRERERLSTLLAEAGALRTLLFEKGKALESSVLAALRTLGFDSSRYSDDSSEFDAVFSCEFGRFIGEVEGKDKKQVNVEKLRQLQMNVHEDLLRDDVDAPAKPVLFGNPFRLDPPGKRPPPFTPKCISAATTMNTALVATTELFRVAQYIDASTDSSFAKECRRILAHTVGVVEFPPTPAK